MKNRIVSLLFCLFLIPYIGQSQGEANNWYFGFGAGLTFNMDGTVNPVNDSAIFSYEGCATISNNLGELQFYTDGTTIYNKNHEIMSNGDGLFGNSTSTQSAIVVPYPDSDNLYIIFTVGATIENIRGRGLNYSIVDINLDNGNGAVIEKNINLLNDCSEKLTAVVKDCTSNAVWILAFATETGLSESRPYYNTFHAFEITSMGVSINSVKSTFANLRVNDDRGYLRLSPNSLKIANANASAGLYLYDFDAQTGFVSNEQELIINSSNTDTYGVEFSPNSQYLYITASNNLYSPNGQESSLIQFDTYALDINTSQIMLDNAPIFRSALQLGPDGKIYRPITINYTTGTKYLGVINDPNMKGIESNYLPNQIELNTGSTAQGLPPFISSFFDTIRLTEEENSTNNFIACEGEPIVLEGQLFAGATYAWEKDGVIFNNPNFNRFVLPISAQSDSGIYKVTIIRPGYTECPITGETTVNIVVPPLASTINGSFCDVNDANTTDGVMTINLNEFSTDPGLSYFYYDSLENLEAGNYIVDAENFVNTNPYEQRLWYKVINENNCEATNTLMISIHAVPDLVMDDSYDFCLNDTNTEIVAPIGFDAYNWYLEENNSQTLIATSETFLPTQEGNYTLEGVMYIGDIENDSFCTKTSSFSVRFFEMPKILEIVIKDNTGNNQIEIIVEGNGDYEYSVDGFNFQESNSFENLPSGMQTVYVNEKNGCGEVMQDFEIDALVSPDQFPNFFTPNGDGFNDFWNYRPSDENNDIDIVRIYIYNRYGKLLYELSPLENGWDGTINGQLQPQDDYWYQALSFEKDPIRGHFTLKY